jgi:hypothetical protein
MRELKNVEIEAVCGGLMARPVCGPVMARPVISPAVRLLVSFLAVLFGIRTPPTKQAA